MPRMHTTVHRTTAQRRRTAWASQQTTALTAPALGNANALDLLGPFEVVGASTLGSTIIRTHLTLSCASATTDTRPGAVFGVIRDTAPPTGANAINPNSQPELDWSWWDTIDPASSQNSILVGTTILYAVRIDIKSKRKFTQLNDRYFFCLFNQGSTTLTYAVTSRVLLALP